MTLHQQIQSTAEQISLLLSKMESLVAMQRVRLVELSAESESTLSIGGIAAVVGAAMNIPRGCLLNSPVRTARVCNGRFMVVWLARQLMPHLNLSDIARALHLDPGTTAHRMRMAEQRLECDKEFREMAEMLLKTLTVNNQNTTTT